MTTLLAAPHSVLEVLRGQRSRRPPTNRSAAAVLRTRLDEGLRRRIGADHRETPLTIGPASLRARVPGGGSPSALVRAVLVTQILQLVAAGYLVEQPFDDAVGAWRAAGPQGELHSYFEALDAQERARLASDVTAHGFTLTHSLGTVPRSWSPRTAVRAHQRLADGDVVLRDLVDLMIGTTDAPLASLVLLDVTTGPLDEGAERVMRYHALVQTLRTCAVPLRTSIFSTGTGELWSTEVDDELLNRAADDVLALFAEESAP